MPQGDRTSAIIPTGVLLSYCMGLIEGVACRNGKMCLSNKCTTDFKCDTMPPSSAPSLAPSEASTEPLAGQTCLVDADCGEAGMYAYPEWMTDGTVCCGSGLATDAISPDGVFRTYCTGHMDRATCGANGISSSSLCASGACSLRQWGEESLVFYESGDSTSASNPQCCFDELLYGPQYWISFLE